jgi:hypothetical protein
MTWLAAQRVLSRGSSGLAQCLRADSVRAAIHGSPRSRREKVSRSVEPGIAGAPPRSVRSESPVHPTGPIPRRSSELSAGVSDRDGRRFGIVMLCRVVRGAIPGGLSLRAIVVLETSSFRKHRLSDLPPLYGSSQPARTLMETC